MHALKTGLSYLPGGSYLVGKNPNENKPTPISTNTSTSDDKDEINQFTDLGDTTKIKVEAENREAQEKIEKLETQNQALSGLQENLNKKAEEDTTTVNAQTSQIAELETQAQQQKVEIEKLNRLLLIATTQANEADTKLERVEQEKSKLETNLANQKRESAKLEAENREAQEKIEKLSKSDETQMGIIEAISKKNDEKNEKITELQIALTALQTKIDNIELEKAGLDGTNQGLQELLEERNQKILVLENLKAEYQAALSGNGKIAKEWNEIDSAYAEIQKTQSTLDKSKTTLEEKEKERQRNIFEAKPKTSAAITSSAAAASVGVTLCFVVPLVIKALAITGAAALAVTIGLPVLCGAIGAAVIGLAAYGIYKLATKPKESTAFYNPQPSKEKGSLLMCEPPPTGIYEPQT